MLGVDKPIILIHKVVDLLSDYEIQAASIVFAEVHHDNMGNLNLLLLENFWLTVDLRHMVMFATVVVITPKSLGLLLPFSFVLSIRDNSFVRGSISFQMMAFDH